MSVMPSLLQKLEKLFLDKLLVKISLGWELDVTNRMTIWCCSIMSQIKW